MTWLDLQEGILEEFAGAAVRDVNEYEDLPGFLIVGTRDDYFAEYRNSDVYRAKARERMAALRRERGAKPREKRVSAAESQRAYRQTEAGKEARRRARARAREKAKLARMAAAAESLSRGQSTEAKGQARREGDGGGAAGSAPGLR